MKKRNGTDDASCVHSARTSLLAWFDVHRRDLPWRRTRDPYAIWVSEVMLQQTRVETVVPYYARFLSRFPTVRALADASEDDVLAAWAGLGYYRRAKLLHRGARAVADSHAGAVPSDIVALQAVPGIGRYTAGAIASIAFDRREPVLDGNVERVLSRWRAVSGDPRAAAQRKVLWSMASAFASGDRPGDTNQALMELGATVCTPLAPSCAGCPLRAQCAAYAAGEPTRYPEKRARAAVPEERWSALVALAPGGDRVALVRGVAGRFDGMLVPPLTRRDEAHALRRVAGSLGTVRHVLTHAVMHIAVFRETGAKLPAGAAWVACEDLSRRAVPKITERILGAAGVTVTSRT